MGDNPHINHEDTPGWSSLACEGYLSTLSLHSFALLSISQCPWFHIPPWIQRWQGRTMHSPYGARKHWISVVQRVVELTKTSFWGI